MRLPYCDFSKANMGDGKQSSKKKKKNSAGRQRTERVFFANIFSPTFQHFTQ